MTISYILYRQGLHKVGFSGSGATISIDMEAVIYFFDTILTVWEAGVGFGEKWNRLVWITGRIDCAVKMTWGDDCDCGNFYSHLSHLKRKPCFFWQGFVFYSIHFLQFWQLVNLYHNMISTFQHQPMQRLFQWLRYTLSAWLGSATPEGWLCAKMTFPHWWSVRFTTLWIHAVLVKCHGIVLQAAMRRFCASKNKVTNTSCSYPRALASGILLPWLVQWKHLVAAVLHSMNALLAPLQRQFLRVVTTSFPSKEQWCQCIAI